MRELENSLTQVLLDGGRWALEALLVIGIAAVALYLAVAAALILLYGRHVHPRS